MTDDKAGRDDQTEMKAAGHNRIFNGKSRNPSTRSHRECARPKIARRNTVQLRTTLLILGGLVSPLANLTAHHEFLDSIRMITSSVIAALSLLINTGACYRGNDLYTKVAGGFSVDFGNGLNGIVSCAATFG